MSATYHLPHIDHANRSGRAALFLGRKHRWALQQKGVTHCLDEEKVTIMKMMFFGMFAMMDLTGLILAVTTDISYERHALHSLIGSTGSVVVFGALLEPKSPLWFARRSVAAIVIGLITGPLSAEIVNYCFHIEVNAALVVVTSFVMSLGGPYAIQKYGEKAIDAGAEKIGIRGTHEPDQSIIETPNNGGQDTVNGGGGK